jgi:hypothetical protein
MLILACEKQASKKERKKKKHSTIQLNAGGDY